MDIFRLWCGLLALGLAAAGVARAPTAQQMARAMVLFEAGKGGNYTFRIVSRVASKCGALLAFAAARLGTGGNYAPIDTARFANSRANHAKT